MKRSQSSSLMPPKKSDRKADGIEGKVELVVKEEIPCHTTINDTQKNELDEKSIYPSPCTSDDDMNDDYEYSSSRESGNDDDDDDDDDDDEAAIDLIRSEVSSMPEFSWIGKIY